MGEMLKDKVALVAGGSSGIGRAAAVLFAAEGARVVVAARRKEEGEETAGLVRESGGTATFVQALLLFVSALVFRAVRRSGDHAI